MDYIYKEYYKTWLEQKIFSDEYYLLKIGNIVTKYGYSLKENWRLKGAYTIVQDYRNYFANVDFNGLKMTIGTKSSHWSIEESIIFAKELNESIQMISELKVIFDNAERTFKKEFEKEMKEEIAKRENVNNDIQ